MKLLAIYPPLQTSCLYHPDAPATKVIARRNLCEDCARLTLLVSFGPDAVQLPLEAR